MSRNFRPHVGCRLMSSWPVDRDPPPGWERCSELFPTTIARVATGEPADTAVEVEAYTETADCGVSGTKRMTGHRRSTVRGV